MSTITSTAVRFHNYGEPLDVLREETVEIPAPAEGEVRLEVKAVGLNPADWELCRGFMAVDLPRGIGYDVAGVVDAVGPGVDDVTAGDTVFGTADFIGHPSAGVAQSAILDSWYPLPEGLSIEQAAVLPMVVQTARQTLDAMSVRRGETLLVHGAGAMVGFTAVQIALDRGIRVIATAGQTLRSELEGFGAEVTAYGDGMVERVRELAGGSVDHAFDAAPTRPRTIPDLIALTGDASRVTTISNHDEARELGARVNLDHLEGASPASEFLPEFARRAAAGAFVLPIATTLPLGQWREAVELSTSGRPHGKVVLLP